jgi:hypothetical protein
VIDQSGPVIPENIVLISSEENHISVSDADVHDFDRKFDFVQEMLNQVVVVPENVVLIEKIEEI